MKLATLLLMLASVGPAAISLDAINNCTPASGAGTTGVSWTHTIATGANRSLYVVLAGFIEVTPNTPTIDGIESMILVQGSSGSGWVSQIWEMTNPPGGAHTIAVTWASTPHSYDAMACSSFSFFGAAQNRPAASIGANTANTTNSATVSPSLANTWLIAAVVGSDTVGYSATTGQTEINSGHNGNPGWAIGYKGPVSAGSNTITWTYTGGTEEGIALIAVNPAGTQAPFSPPIVTRPSLLSTWTVPANSGGDAQFFAWTSSATRAGNFGGGAIIGSTNDGTGPSSCPSSNVCLYEITAYSSTLPAATFGLVNTMSDYGVSSALSCYDTIHQMKSRKPWAFDTALFLPIFCMSDGSPFYAYQSGYPVSPDGGAHWCNWKIFQAHSTAPNCTAENWVATGSNPVDAAGFQFPLADGTNKMTRMQLVDYLCQDNTVQCPVAAGVDPAYLYFLTTETANGAGSGVYAIRVPKSVGWKGVMNPANFEAYNAGTWTSTLQNASDIGNGILGAAACCSSYTYLKDFGVFAVWTHGSTLFATAPTPWGAWTQTANTFAALGFPGPIAGLCPKYTTPGRVRCTLESSPVTQLTLIEADLGPVNVSPIKHRIGHQ